MLNCGNVGVTLLVYSRPAHTQVVLEAIRAAGIKNLTVLMDGADDETVRARQRELTALVKSIDWAKTRLVHRSTNVGLARSVVSSVREQLEWYEQMILLEDDCVPQPGFFEFMFEALATYKFDRKVRSVCAYEFPFACRPDQDEIHGVPSRRFMPWGWATWRDRWQDYTLDLESLVAHAKRDALFDALPNDLRLFCEDPDIVSGRGDIWSINWTLLHYITRTLAVCPSTSLVENIGFDGTGVHCAPTDEFASVVSTSAGRVKLPGDLKPDAGRDRQVESFLHDCAHKIMVKALV